MVNRQEETSPVRHSHKDGNPVPTLSNAKQNPLDIRYQLSTIPPLVVIVGETASGKTAAATEVAKQVNGEIICADSRTIYKKMDIGTAKPSTQEQQNIPHHLISIIEPDEVFSAAKFQELANKCIREIADRGKIPIIVGGTGLYINALLYNFQFASVANEAHRQQLEQMNDDELTTLMNTKNIDQSNLNTKNRRHVIRAIERNGEKPIKQNIRKNTIVLGIKIDREVLRERVTERTEQMFQAGFLDEAVCLIDQYGAVESLKIPGYDAVRSYLKDEIDIDEVKRLCNQADMNLAKRQRTWFKRSKDIEWFEERKELVDTAVKFAISSSST